MMDDSRTSLEDREESDIILNKRFKSEEAGFRFFNNYALAKGFGIWKDYVERDCSTRKIVLRRYLCSREGERKEKYMDMTDKYRDPHPLTRCGCKAMIVIALDKSRGDWFVKEFVGSHNHETAKPDEVVFLRSHRGLSDAQKAAAIELKEGGLHKFQVMELMDKQHDGFEEVGFTSRDFYNFFERQKKKQIEKVDAHEVIKYFHARQREDMEFFFEYELDDSRHLRRLFWADPQNRIDYDAFGDVVVFDSTYRVNKYNLPFIPFVGVNHHRSTVIFACGIVADETVDTYKWLLQTFLNCMCLKHPISLITDGDNAMRRAIEIVMPNSDHRLCTWHTEQNMARHLPPAALPDFREFVHSPFGVDEFERKWNVFKERSDVSEDNSWLEWMYNLRTKWAAAYTKGRVFLGMKSNQRSESLNSNLHRNLNRKLCLFTLVDHFEHCLSRMHHKEAELDAIASQSVPFTRLDAGLLEKHAALQFSPKAFKLVKDEIYKSMDGEIRDIRNADNMASYMISLKDKIVCVTCIFDGMSLKSVTCHCRKLECEYIPCHHVFGVLMYMNEDRIPQFCIMRRWTIKAKSAFHSDRYGKTYSWSDQMERYRQLRSMGNKALFKASMTEETSLKVMKFLRDILDEEHEGNNIKDATLYGHVLAQSAQSDKQNEEKKSLIL